MFIYFDNLSNGRCFR